ncbi:MAG: S1C family serine protease [Prevotellaceae bacterium]|nr:S1C family serine protease [Prevotellaceae bacterium]
MAKYIALVLGVAMIIAVFYALFSSSGEDLDFVEAVSSKAVSANILLINTTEVAGSISYSAGQSGVIYQRENEKYYVLTALHGIPIGPDSNDIKLLVLGYNQPEYKEAGVNIGLKAYYSQFPQAVLEYYDEAYDLAVISFQSGNDYPVLPIASEPPKYGEAVAAIGNPHVGNRNSVATGKITSKKPVPFGDKAGENQYKIIQHSAKTSVGCSGGALLNKDLEITGINLGAGENIFRQFKVGKVMPCDKILEFLAGWEE